MEKPQEMRQFETSKTVRRTSLRYYGPSGLNGWQIEHPSTTKDVDITSGVEDELGLSDCTSITRSML